MALADYVRVNAVGRFFSGPWTGEEAQVGISLCNVVGGAPDTGIDDGLFPISVEPGGGSEVVAGLGRFDYGSHGADGELFSKADQQDIATAFRVYLLGRNAYWSTNFRWEELRLSAVLPDGKIVNGATVVTYESPVTGSDSSSDFPPQMAVVQSLMTGGRGPRNRGRIYLPLHSDTMGSGGMVTATPAGNLNTATKLLKDTIETDTEFEMRVVSPTHHTASRITTFRVGNHYDTQRRRAQQVPESFWSLEA